MQALQAHRAIDEEEAGKGEEPAKTCEGEAEGGGEERHISQADFWEDGLRKVHRAQAQEDGEAVAMPAAEVGGGGTAGARRRRGKKKKRRGRGGGVVGFGERKRGRQWRAIYHFSKLGLHITLNFFFFFDSGCKFDASIH